MADGKGMVLVVDDDEGVRELLSRIVSKAGYEVDVSRDGGEALEKLAKNDYSLVLLDLMMPTIDGLEVLSRMNDNGHDVPVIVLTAGDDSLIRKVPPPHASNVIRKPFDVHYLIERINQMAA